MKVFEMGRVRIGLSDISDGNMKTFTESEEVLANRRRFLSEMRVVFERAGFVKVEYDGVEDFCVFSEMAGGNLLSLNLGAERADGLAVRGEGVGLFLPLADCLGLVLFDEMRGVLMVVHCGRQTVVQDGARKAVEFMKRECGASAEDVRVWMSPSAGKENYPVFDLGGKGMQEAVVEQLVGAGVLLEKMVLSEVDTTEDENYWSHSRGDTGERFAICAVMEQ
ncbi:laccase domain-containing protein [Candidatus Saccharibacteria bacterium]|nr:laccase domain-containing protein [Candidatus Saccharibacteria bacterium]